MKDLGSMAALHDLMLTAREKCRIVYDKEREKVKLLGFDTGIEKPKARFLGCGTTLFGLDASEAVL